MKVIFSDKINLKKELKNKSNRTLNIRFNSEKSLTIDKNILDMIRQFDKNDKTFLKNLMASENSFILFLTKIIKK
jgi:hypothetical protein